MHLTIGQVLDQRYRIEEALGHGGFALVYRASDVRTGKQVALKTHRTEKPEQRKALFEEFTQLRPLKIARIPAMFEQFESKGQLFVVMEYIPGRTLDAWLSSSDQPLPMRLVLDWIQSLLETLAELHQRGLTHRDVKPTNVVIHAETGLPYLIDFGLAKEQGQTRVQGYSPNFAAPEQITPFRSTSPATDVYAVGAMLWYMLCNEQARNAQIGEAQADDGHLATITTQLEDNPWVSQSIIQVITRALAYDPAKRFVDAGAMLAALRLLSLPLPQVTVPISSYGDPQQQVAAWDAELKATHARQAALEAQIRALQQELNERQQSKASQAEGQAQLAATMAALAVAQQELDQRAGQLGQIQAQLEQSAQQRRTLESERDGLRAQMAATQQELDRRTGQLGQMQAQFEQGEQQRRTLEGERDGLSAQVRVLSSKVERFDEQAKELQQLQSQRKALGIVASVCAIFALLTGIGMIGMLLRPANTIEVPQVTVEVTREVTSESGGGSVQTPVNTLTPTSNGGSALIEVTPTEETPTPSPTPSALLSEVTVINGTRSEGVNSWPAVLSSRLPLTLQLNGSNLQDVTQLSLVPAGTSGVSVTLSLLAVTPDQVIGELRQQPTPPLRNGTYEIWLNDQPSGRYLDLQDYLRVATGSGITAAHLYSADVYPPMDVADRPKRTSEVFVLLYKEPDRTKYLDWNASVRRNDQLEILDDSNPEWYRVRLRTNDRRNGQVGWVLRWVVGEGTPPRAEPEGIQIPRDLRGQPYQIVETELQARGIPSGVFVRDLQDRNKLGAVYDQFAANAVVSTDPPLDGWWVPGRSLILGIRAP